MEAAAFAGLGIELIGLVWAEDGVEEEATDFVTIFVADFVVVTAAVVVDFEEATEGVVGVGGTDDAAIVVAVVVVIIVVVAVAGCGIAFAETTTSEEVLVGKDVATAEVGVVGLETVCCCE